ncbi:MAG: flagellar basal body P-ring protein FlgI [Alphaproteobacteria bacterium]
MFIKKSAFLFIMALLLAGVSTPASSASRIKDIASFEGVRDNALIGYGLVVGLDGTGDSLNKSIFTRESLIGMLERLGVNARDKSLKTKNVAAVIVTASLPPFARQGSKIDITVSAIGDAKSLAGGTLLVTPLKGADSTVYAIAQGSLTVGGMSASGKNASIKKGVLTAAKISNGALVEKELSYDFSRVRKLKLALRNPDFTTSKRVADVINYTIDAGAAFALDPGTVQLTIPEFYHSNPVKFMTQVEQLYVKPDQPAKILIDDQTGLIIMGENVKINKIALAQGDLTISISESEDVSQPEQLSFRGKTKVTNNTDISIDDGSKKKLALLDTGVKLNDLVNALNALGVGPKDLISILQGIKASGALQAEIVIM